MGFLAPTGILLPSLALTNVSYKAWWTFIYPFLIFLLLSPTCFYYVKLKCKVSHNKTAYEEQKKNQKRVNKRPPAL